MKKKLFKVFAICIIATIAMINISIGSSRSEGKSFLEALVKQAIAESEDPDYPIGDQYWYVYWELCCDKSHNSPCEGESMTGCP